MASRRSRRSIPPDGYIPTVGPDAVISLPPPFELSQPVDLGPTTGEQANVTISTAISTNEGERKDSDRQSEKGSQKAPKARDYVYGSTSGAPQPTYDDVFRDRGKARETPAMSTASTHISQYELISPPRDSSNRDRERARERKGYESNGSERRGRANGKDAVTSASSKIGERVEAWRAASPSVIASPTPRTPTLASGRRPTSAMSSIYAMGGGNGNPIEVR